MPTANDAVWIDVLPNMSKFGPALAGGVNKGLAGAQTRMNSVGKSMTRKVTLPIIGAGVAILKMSGDFEKGMNKVGALTGATGKDLDAMREQAKKLGATTQFSASQAADAMSFLGMAGFETNEIMAAMPGTLDLAAASGMDLAQTADIMSNVLTGFGKEAGEAGHLSDVMAKAVSSANTDMMQLGDAMKYVAPVAASAGVSLEETTAAIGLLGNAGIQGSMAGTTLRGAISKMLDPTEKAATALERLGMWDENNGGSQLLDSAGNLKPLNEIIEMLGKSGATTADYMTLFGQRAGPGMAALVAQGADELRGLTGDLENAGGAAKEMADKQMEGLNGEMLKLKSAAEGLAISIGESGLLEMVTRLVTRFTGLISSMSETNPRILKMVAGFALAVAVIGPLLLIGAKLVGLVLAIKKGMVMLSFATKVLAVNAKVLWFVLSANPIGFVIIGLVALGAALVVAYKKSETFRRIVDAAWAAIRKGISFAWNRVIKPVLTAMKAYLERVLFPVYRALWDKVIKPVFAAIKFGIKVAWNVMRLIFDAWRAYFTKILFPVIRFLWKNVIKPIFSSIGAYIKHTWRTTIKPIFEALGSFIRKTVAPAFRKGVDAIGSAWDRVKDMARKPVNFVIDTVYNNGIRKSFNKIAGFLGSKAKLPHMPTIGGGSAAPRSGRSAPGSNLAAAGGAGGIGSLVKKVAGMAWSKIKDRFMSPITSRLAKVGSSPWAQMMAGAGKRLAGAGLDKLKAIFGAAEGDGATGPMGKAGVILPRGKYRIGMPYLGYPGHYGSDYPAATGTPVYSMATGRVAKASTIAGSYGKHVYIDHPGGIQTRYAHLNAYNVRAGQTIRGGQMLGSVGSTGNSTGPHLHFEYRKNGSPVNPANLGLFDNGGLLKQGMLAYHAARKPDRVLTDSQWNDMHKIAQRGGGSGHQINVTMPATATPEAAYEAAGGRIIAALSAGGV